MVATTSESNVYLYAKQEAFLASKSWIRGFVAGRGAGKTTVGALDILNRAKHGEPYMAVSPSYVVMSDTTWPAFEEQSRRTGQWIRGVRTPIPRIWFHTQDGGVSDLVFRTGEDPESLRGPSKAGLWLDEASIMSEEVFRLALPVLRFRGRMGGISLTFTPKGKNHWTYKTFFERVAERWNPKPATFLVQAHTKDNPFLPAQFHDAIASQYTRALAAQELAGEFVDLLGLMFQRHWFEFVTYAPAECNWVRYWDKAGTHGAGDYSVGALMGRHNDGVFYIADVVRGQWSPFERNKVMLATAERDAAKYGNRVQVIFEQEPGSGGKESALVTLREMAAYPVRRDVVSQGKRQKTVDGLKLPGPAKVVRSGPFAAQCEAGNVKIVRGKFADDLLDELAAFPEQVHDDQVDACAGAYNKLVAAFGPAGSISAATRTGVAPVDPQERYGVQGAPSPNVRRRSLFGG